MEAPVVIFWFRRDLRVNDNAGLYHALKSGYKVVPVFIFDINILDRLEPYDQRISFICDSLNNLNLKLRETCSQVITFHTDAGDAFRSLMHSHNIKSVYTNKDYEPYAIKRDGKIRDLLKTNGIQLFEYKDHVIFEQNEIVKSDGKPYTVFTPYSRKWHQLFSPDCIKEYDSESLSGNFYRIPGNQILKPELFGFHKSTKIAKPYNLSEELLMNYHLTRDIPSENGTSFLGPHLRFGTISIREVFRKALGLNKIFLTELIWRDFFIQILYNYPHVAENSFKPQYDRIEWVNNEEYFEKWCSGHTGFPIVDAGMRELEETGYMHNRIRMVVANFLTRYLLTDWRWGEAWFASKLFDYELASNNGNWQWAAGTGCDAAPYFRIFNPYKQQAKFDQEFKYVKKWVPEYGTSKYPKPVVDISDIREKAISLYKSALNI
jgi:deoxyribodipyrimidine photo-lyase